MTGNNGAQQAQARASSPAKWVTTLHYPFWHLILCWARKKDGLLTITTDVLRKL